jgi:hypothetical protein
LLKVIMSRTQVGFEMRQKAKSLRVNATRTETLPWYEQPALKADGDRRADAIQARHPRLEGEGGVAPTPRDVQ